MSIASRFSTAAEAPAAIRIRGLTKRYADLTALHGIDLDVAEGEFFGLLGPNGAGKTTTINIMAGLCIKTGGEVTLFGHDLIRDYRACRQRVGLVPQEFNFDQFIRLRTMLMFQAGFFGIPRRECARRTDALLEQFELTAKGDARMRQLSGGMKRRAIIARGLVHGPRLVILDEPTAGVDVELRKSLWTFLRKLKQEGTTILLTTHYIEEAEALCDRIAIIHEGRIIANDTTRNLVNRLSREAIVVTSAAPIAPAAVAALAEYGPALNRGGDELSLAFDKSAVDFETVIGRVAQAGIRIAGIRPADNRLEQVFMQLIRRPRE